MLSRNCFGIEVFRSSMPKERIDIDGAKTYGPYSPGVKSNGMIWLAGQIALEAGEDIKSQTRGCLRKIDDLLSAGGVTKNNVCFVQVLLADINDFDSMNEVYTEWLNGVKIPPARAAFEAGNLPKAARIEIVVQATE
jgi:2-iminobutanoate/2-iminopropanoate deaminase